MAKFDSLRKDAREFAENMEVFAQRRGASLQLEMGGLHPKLVFKRGDKVRKYAISATSSDWRGFENARHHIKRIFVEMGWEKEEELAVSTFHNPSAGAASPVRIIQPALHQVTAAPVEQPTLMTAPPLSSADAIHLLGWEVPFVPESAIQTESTRGGRKGPEYIEFARRRNHWVSTVLRAGAKWPDIVETLAKAGHVTTEGALKQALNKEGVQKTVGEVVRRSQPKPIGDLMEKMNDVVQQIVERATGNLVKEVENLTIRLAKAEDERNEYKNKYETIKEVLKDF